MGLSSSKDRIMTTVDKSVKEELEKLALEDERTLSAYCSIVLKNHVKNSQKK